MSTDHNEAMRLADRISPETDWYEFDQVTWCNEAAALLRQQAERIAELEGEIANLHTTMFAAAVEIQEHWDAHCDAEGYGPANLMHRLERGIASQYGYDAKTLQRVEAERDQLKTDLHIATDDAAQMLASTQSLRSERDQLRAEVERLRPNAERYEWLRDNLESEWAICEWQDDPDGIGYYRDARAPEFVDAAIDQARTTHKDEG